MSTFVSAGNKADVSSNDLLQYWDADAHTDVVLLYLESFGNPRTFARVARRLSRRKPIVAVKSGRSPAGWRAASAHTAALAAADAAVDALFRQSGVIRVDTLHELFDVAQVLATQPLPPGRAVAIVANAGGPGVLAADACEAAGLEVPELAPATRQRLEQLLGQGAAVANPVDLPHTISPEDFREALVAALADPAVAAALAIFAAPLAPFLQEMGAALVAAAREEPAKPLLSCLLGRGLISQPDGPAVPSFAFPESAALALSRVARYAEWRARPEGPPAVVEDVERGDARQVVDGFLAGLPGGGQGGWLDPAGVSRLLGDYGIPLAPEPGNRPVEPGNRPVDGPVPGVEVEGGVEVEAGVEVELGVEVEVDPLFGRLVALRTGGVVGSLVNDRQFRALPLSDLDARDLIGSVRAAPLLEGRRGAGAPDIDGVVDLLLRVGALVEDLPEVVALTLDPVVASADGARVGGATIRLAPWRPRAEPALRRLR